LIFFFFFFFFIKPKNNYLFSYNFTVEKKEKDKKDETHEASLIDSFMDMYQKRDQV